MLGYEYERMFDSTLKKVLPYLILPPNEFRNDLADRMAGLFHFLRGDNSEVMFIDLNKKINEIIDPDKRKSWDSSIEIEIHDFNGRQMSFDDRIRKINERLTKLEKKMERPVIPLQQDFKTIIEPKTEIAEKTEPLPIIAEKIKPEAIIEDKIKPEVIIVQKLELIKNYLKTNKRVTNKEAREICGVNINQAQKLLQKLVKENFVRQMGKKKGTYYELMNL
ncbi:MAG: hypothetical protein OIN86_09505 [Candidatus Methanoperedens sp.]|nr:hypothetical protein [Candidatus Methanoperedens sp.]CAG0980605.1 hypothetical protein METP1_01752 [Methanosarcinales archaeon]